MRPGQNKRMRGRPNRKGPNPLTRAYESNGPDVKIRGTAHHVAEKYLQLARDAHSSGDPVMAESYLQHAEHYFRLIAAAQLAQQQTQTGYLRGPDSADLDEDEDDDDFGVVDRFASPPERAPATPAFSQPQQQPPAHFSNAPQPYVDRPQSERPQFQERGPRPERQPFQDRNGQNRHRGNRDPRRDQSVEPTRLENKPADIEAATALPAFITGGTPRTGSPVVTETIEPPQPQQPAVAIGADIEGEHEGANYHLRSRRRRRKPGQDEDSDQTAEQPAQTDVAAGS